MNMELFIQLKLNQEFIAKNLCVKKEIEDNDCNGSCCLKMALEKAEKKEKESPQFLKQQEEAFQDHEYILLHLVQIENNVEKAFNYIESYTFQYHKQLLRPPNHESENLV